MNFTIQFRSRGLVEFSKVNQSTRSDGVEKTKSADTISLCSVLGHFEGHSNVRHGTKVVNLMRPHFRDNVEQVGGVTKITIMKEKLQSRLK